ncbi:small GTPase [Naegleria gruberi]|uniref:Small GTPase n=1 Tax=Naegleria gruberi TaxID=5762 RepID=D2VLL9_NAEGR|nr:small GTPase [Naegleria gruberi]EFC42413.1 small GTPase [Naegleria gruberi]|eukprot:XP_002675157.1 small GTPase [Naegleria gruberi]
MTHLIFSVVRVCRSWREISLPIIWKRYQDYAQLVDDDSNNSGGDEAFSSLFQSRMGRNFIKMMFKEHVYELATRLIGVTKMGEVRTQNLHATITMDFCKKEYEWFGTELEMIECYSEFFGKVESPINSDQVVSNNSKVEIEKKSDEKNSSGVMSSVLHYLSSFFKNNSSASSIQIERKPNKPMITEGTQIFKVIMLGDCYVGKTSTLECAIKNINCRQKEDMPTIGASFLKQRYKLIPNSISELQLWDYSGPERFATLSPIYYRGGHVAFAMFDLSNSALTLDRLDRHIKDLEQHNPMEVVLVGTKSDLVTEKERKYRKRAQLLAFDKLKGGLYVEITNTDIKYAHSLLVYSAIILHLKYSKNIKI